MTPRSKALGFNWLIVHNFQAIGFKCQVAPLQQGVKAVVDSSISEDQDVVVVDTTNTSSLLVHKDEKKDGEEGEGEGDAAEADENENDDAHVPGLFPDATRGRAVQPVGWLKARARVQRLKPLA